MIKKKIWRKPSLFEFRHQKMTVRMTDLISNNKYAC